MIKKTLAPRARGPYIEGMTLSTPCQAHDTVPAPPPWEPVKICTKCSTPYDAESWAALPYVGEQVFPEADEYGDAERIELRNCPCGSTLAVVEAL